MAAPDRVYRYFTNLKAKDSDNDVYFIRCAKPLLTYIPNGAVTREQKEAAIKSLFKLDGILWLKNPDVPHSASDADIKVEVEDPTNPGQTIEIDDPDLGDPDRSGFIGYVFQNGDNAVFHDIRTGPINNGVQSIATDFSRRSWSRASRLRYREWFDPEVPNSDKGEAIILNDAGLNRRGECAVKDTQQREEFTFDLYADGNCVFYYKGTYTAPIYNRATSWGIRYKTHAAPHIQNQAVLDEITANTIEENISIARGATLNFLTNPHPFKLGIGDSETLTVGDYFYFAPFITNEEGTYELPVSNNTFTIVPRFKLKVKCSNVSDSSNQQQFFTNLDAETNNPSQVFDDASNISDDNGQNRHPFSTIYLDGRLDSADSSGLIAYNVDYYASDNTVPYNDAGTDDIPGFFYGPLTYYEEYLVYRYTWVFLEKVGSNENEHVEITDSGFYEPLIPGVQDVTISIIAEWTSAEKTAFTYQFDLNNLFSKTQNLYLRSIKLKYYDSREDYNSKDSHDASVELFPTPTRFTVQGKSRLSPKVEGTGTVLQGALNKEIYTIEATYDLNQSTYLTIRFELDSPAGDSISETTP
jgi:hypothetical protein